MSSTSSYNVNHVYFYSNVEWYQSSVKKPPSDELATYRISTEIARSHNGDER